MIAKFCHIKYNSTDIKKEERQKMRREKEIIGYLPQELSLIHIFKEIGALKLGL